MLTLWINPVPSFWTSSSSLRCLEKWFAACFGTRSLLWCNATPQLSCSFGNSRWTHQTWPHDQVMWCVAYPAIFPWVYHPHLVTGYYPKLLGSVSSPTLRTRVIPQGANPSHAHPPVHHPESPSQGSLFDRETSPWGYTMAALARCMAQASCLCSAHVAFIPVKLPVCYCPRNGWWEILQKTLLISASNEASL